MVVLRSREIVHGRSPSQTLEKKLEAEPPTPAKTHDRSRHPRSSPSQRSISSPHNSDDVGCGSDLVSDSVAVRRWSRRLASKSNTDEETSVSISDGRPKCKGFVAEDGLGSSLSSGRTSTAAKVKEKRKLGNVLDMELGGGHERENDFLNLRSGAKIAKRRIDGDGVALSAVKNRRDPSDKERDMGGNDKEVDKKSTYESGDGGLPELEKELNLGDEGSAEDGVTNKSKSNAVSDASVNLTPLTRFSVSVQDRQGVADNNRNKGVLIDESPKIVAAQELEKELIVDDGRVKSRRFSLQEKGKWKLGEDPLMSGPNHVEMVVEPQDNDSGPNHVEMVVEPKDNDSIDNTAPDVSQVNDGVALRDEQHAPETTNASKPSVNMDHKERFRDIARRNAARFAHFSSQEEEKNNSSFGANREEPSREGDQEIEDWPGPFSTAMKIIKDRAMNMGVQHPSSSEESKSSPIMWCPRDDNGCRNLKPSVPSLQELSITILAKNVEAITSLERVPDELRNKLSRFLSDSRRMTSHFLELLFFGSPTEICVRDCSWLTEEQFTRAFERCDSKKLTVLQLDQCGRCMPDYILQSTLARSSHGLLDLTTISLKGACRLSDVGLNALVSAAPQLKSINLSQCSLLTSTCIDTLAGSLGSVLRELYIDDCQDIDVMCILPALNKLEHLEVLSLARIQTVCDDFIRRLITIRGQNMKELTLTDCVKLTDSSLKVISETCSRLCALDLVNLSKLTDSAIGYLANGCQAIHTLKLSRNAFSDEAVAAFLEMCGEFLIELSLNNVKKIGDNTAISLAKHSKKLLSLDLSWCRMLTDKAMGLIVDSCSSLRVLKLFGCTQITNFFLDGHSNTQVKIIGMKMSSVLENVWEL